MLSINPYLYYFKFGVPLFSLDNQMINIYIHDYSQL